MGGGLLFIGIGALFAFYGMRFIRDKKTNYRFTKGLTLIGLALVCLGTFPQAQRFGSGTQILGQLFAFLVIYGLGGAVVGFLIDWYRRQNNVLNPAYDPTSLQGGELDSKEQTSSGSTSQLSRAYQSKTALSAADLVRLEQITSLRDRGTLSQSQFEMERDIILGAAEPISKPADAPPAISPPPLPPPSPPPPPPPPAISSTAATNVQGTNGTNVIFIIVILLFLLIAVVAFFAATQSSPVEESAEIAASGTASDVVDNEDANNCYKAVDEENWQAAWYSCPAAAEKGDVGSADNLGYLYSNGLGVEANQTEAVGWFRKGAEQGSAYAQYNLAVAYEYGAGVTQNLDEALNWYKKAAEQGNADAQKRLDDLQSTKLPQEGQTVEEAERPLVAIPAQFLGEWNDDLQACGTGLSDGRLQVYADRLRFYESTGYVKSLKLINPQTVRVELSYAGEGSTWNGTETLILSGSGTDLKIDDFWRSKC